MKNLPNLYQQNDSESPRRGTHKPSKRELLGFMGGIKESAGSTVAERLGSCGELARHCSREFSKY